MRYLILLAAIALSACTKPHATELTPHVKMPDGLKDCTFYKVKPAEYEYEMLIVRCPASETSTYEQHGCGKGCTRKNANTVVSP